MPVTIDTTAPAAPVADVAASSDTGVSNTDNLTNDTTPSIAGSGTPGDTITVTMPGTNEVLTTTVQPDGTWSVTPTQALADGNQPVSVTATDPAGNTGSATLVPLTIDTTAPVITITSIAGETISANLLDGTFDGIERGALNSNTVITRPVIAGTTDAEVGQVVTITLDGKNYSTSVVAGQQGQPNQWSYTLSNSDALALNHGNAYPIVATVSDKAGNSAVADKDNSLIVNIAPPDIPTIVEQYSGDHTPTVTGHAQKQIGIDANNNPIYANLTNGDLINVTVDGINYSFTVGQAASAPVGLSYDNNSGVWTLVPQTLANGDYEVAVSVSAAGIVKSDISSNELHINDTPPAITINAISGGVINGVESSQSLPISGTTDAPIGATVTVSINGHNYSAQVQPGANNQPNTFSVNVPATDVAALADGTQTVTASVVNQYGVTGSDSETVLVDTTPPAAPVADVAASSDTGLSNTDNLTTDTTPTITGTGTPGDTITVTMPGSNEVLTTTVQPNGTWSVTPTQALADGNQPVSVTATDPAGNTSPATLVPLTIDTTAPVAPTGSLDPASDSGTLGDSITNDTTPTISGTGATPGDTITLYAPDGTTPLGSAEVAPNGSWAITPTTPLADGLQNLSITATDPAGNESAPSSVPVTIDTTAPIAPVADVAAASDTGISHTDNITNDTTPTISGVGTPGDTITVTFPTGEVKTATVDQNGDWSVTPTQTLPQGTQTVAVTATDPAGNTSPATEVPVTIDTTAPTAPAAALDAGSDTGTPNDGITSDTTPTITGTGTPGDLITLYAPDGTTPLGTAEVAPDGSWAITPNTPLADGLQNLKVTATDPAGNPSSATTVPVTIDTIAPVITITSIAGNTISASSADGIFDAAERGTGNTVTTLPVIAGTTDAEVGQTLTVTLNGHSYTTTVQAGGTWSINSISNADALALQHGTTYPITVSVADVAGNVSNLSGNGLTIDIATPDIPTVIAVQTADHTPTLGGSAEKLVQGSTPTYVALSSGDTLTVTITDSANQTQTYSLTVGSGVTTSANGLSYDASNHTWSLAVPSSSPLSNGTYQVGVAVSAGGVNKTDISTNELVINDAHPAITLDPISGGTINAQESGQPLPISGTTDAQPGSTVTVTIDGHDYTAIVQAGTTPGSNSFSVLVPGSVVDGLADGTQTVSASVTNQFGVTGTDTETVLVDTIAPAIPIGDVAAASDTGVSQTDNVTADTTPTIIGSGATPGDTIDLYAPDGTLLGSAPVQADGTWSITVPNNHPLAEGPQNLSITATDPAGNTSAPGEVPVTIDTTAPVAPTGVLNPISDSGVLGDSITNDSTPTISGTGTPGETITLYAANGTTPLGTAVVAANGSWEITPSAPLADGLQNLSITATDPAGNESTHSPVPVTIDTSAPTAPAADVTATAANDTGTSNTDNVTANNTPEISGSGATAGDTITVTFPTGEQLTTVVDQNGDWSVTPTLALADGSQTVTVTATDPAGNTSQPTNVALTIDTTAPAIAWSSTVPVTGVTGTLMSGTTSNDTQPTLSFSAEHGSIVEIFDGTTSLGFAVEDSNQPGTFSFTPSTALSQGPHSFTATATDAAGNISEPTPAFLLTIDTTAPSAAGALGPISDTGVTGDNITSDTTPTISGTGTPGDTIALFDGTTPLGSAVVDANGNWSITPTTPLPDGLQALDITATDPAGNTSAPIAVTPFTIDNTAPTAPTGDVAASSDSGVSNTDNITSDNTPTITGQGSPGDLITLYAPDGTTPLGSAIVDAQGNWNITPINPLVDGLQNLAITATDAAGNESTPTPIPVTIDTSAPAIAWSSTVPVVDDVAAITGVLTSGAISNDDKPTLTFTAEAGSQIAVYDNGVLLGNAVEDPNHPGTFSFTPSTGLAQGAHSFTAKATDTAGNTSPATSAFALTIDTTPPVVPTVTALTSNSLTPVISGGATLGVGEVLTVTVNGATYTVDPAHLITGISFSNGTWSIDTATATPDSGTQPVFSDTTTYSITATATDAAGNASTDSSSNELRIDTTMPSVTIPEGPLVNATEAADGTAIVTALPQGAQVGDTVITVVTPANGGTPITLTTVLSQADINTHSISQPLTSAQLTAGGDGSWTTSTTVTPQGSTIAGTPVTNGFSLDTTAPAISLTAVTDNLPGITGTLTSGALTNDNTPSLSFTAEAGSTVNVYDGSTLLGTAIEDPTQPGSFSFTPSNPLSDGPHSFTATATDAAGNTSAPTSAFPLTIDATAPSVPVLTLADDNVAGGAFGALSAGATTNDATPTLTFTAEAGSTVNVYDGTTLLGTATEGPSGTFTYTPSTLADGPHTFSATAADAAGNTSAPTAGFVLIVDTIAPSQPSVAVPEGPVVNHSEELSNGGTPVVTSLPVDAQVGDTVTTIVTPPNGGTPITLTTVLTLSDIQRGNISQLITTAQLTAAPDGNWTTSTTITDTAGNVSPAATGGFSVDTTVTVGSGALTAVAGNDSGSLGDNLTNDSTPAVSGVTEPNAAVSVVINGQTYTTTANSSGAWSVTAANLSDGTYTPVITVTDPEGNTATANGTPFTVDTTPPAAPVVTNQTATSLLPTISGTAVVGIGETLTVVVNGATYTVNPSNPATGITWNNGAWSVDLATAQPSNGSLTALQYSQTYDVTATVTDAAGNPASDSSSGELQIAGTTLTAALAAASDTGVSNHDGITNDTTPTITGVANPGETITLYTGPGTTGPVLGTTVADASGNWSFTTAILPAATYSFGVTTTASSGVVSQPVAVPVTIDTAAPVVSVTSVFNDAVDDSSATTTIPSNGTFDGSERGITIDPTATNGFTFNATVNPEPTIVGTATGADGRTLTLNLNGHSYTTNVQSGGAWSVTIPSADAVLLNHGSTYNITASVSDLAGNTGMDTNNGVIINIAPPDVPTVVSQITTSTTPTITGLANKIDNGNTVALINGDSLTVVVKDSSGNALHTYTLIVGGTSSPAGLSYSNGTWTLHDTANSLAIDTYNIEVSSTAANLTRTDISTSELKIVAPVSITSIPEAASNSVLNNSEAADGTTVNVNLTNTGAVAGDVIRVMWDGQPVNVVLTAADIAANSVAVTVSSTVLQAATATNTSETLQVTAALISGATTISTSANNSAFVDFRSPTTPTISATAWAATGAANSSSLTGVGEAQYAVDYNTTANSFVNSGTVDSILWNSEFIGMGTVVRVQLPGSSAAVPAAAGNILNFNWGTSSLPSYTLLAADITRGYVDVTVSEAIIRQEGYGNILATANLVNSSGNASGLASQMVNVAFDLPLALPASTTNPTYGYAINGAGPLATVTAINNTRDAAGGGVTNMGDLNGDGFDDYAISDSGNSNIYVVFGQSGNQALNLSSISAGQGGGYFIDVSSGLGYGPYWNVASSDVNGDGLNDLMVGLTMVGNDVRTDSAYVIYGKSTTTAIALSTIENGTTPQLGFKIRDANIPGVGTTTYSSLGGRSATSGGGGSPNNIGITSAGDVNGDGFEDYIFGEPTVLTTGWSATEPGRAFVLFGTSAGYSNTLLPIMSSNPSSMTNGFFINGNTATGLSLGASVGGGGDVNGDGLDDLVVSNMASSTKTASVFVVYGKTDGLTLNVSSLTAAGSTNGFQIINAAQTTSSAGVTLAAPGNETNVQLIGDVNGDGLADIAVSMYDRAVVVFGKATSSTVDAAAIAAGTSTDGFVIKGDSAKTGAFGFVVNAGDMNGDGLADMVVATGSSRAYVVFGQTAGATAINLTAPDITKFVAIANEVNSTMQSSISNVGDINGDGFDDIAIGIALADPAGGTNFGKTYVVYGGFSDVTSAVFQVSNGDVIGTSGADTINGTSGSNQLVGGAGDDLITGNGGADVMLGGAGNDTFVLNADNVAMLARNSGNTAQNIARINGGNGIDTIKLDSANLDLTVVQNVAIDGIERFNLAGNGSTLKMGPLDVIQLSQDNNAFNTATGWTATASGGATGWGAVNKYAQAVVDGDSSNVLTLVTGWTNIGTVEHTENSVTTIYKVLQHNSAAAQVLVANNVQVRMPPSVVTTANELAGGLNYTEAQSSSGTPVQVSLADTGAVAGNTVQLNWGGQTISYTLTAQDITNGYANVPVPTSTLTTVTALGTTGNVSSFVTLLDGANTVSVSDPATVAVNFVMPTAPTINSTLWAATGAGNTSSLTGVGEANFAADSTSFVTTGTVDGILWNSEIIGNGTVVRVQLPTTATVPPVAGDTVRLNWGGTDIDVTVTSAMITAKYLDITVPEVTIRTAGYGDVAVTAQIIKPATGNGSALASQTVKVAFDLPLALPADASNPSYGYVINGAGPNATTWSTNNTRDAMGSGVTNLGDMNGDGLDDYMVADTTNGKAYVVFGQSGMTGLNISAVAAGTGGFVIDALSGSGQTGGVDKYTLLASSDLNGDGLNDIAVGLNNQNADGAANTMFVVYGKTSTSTVALYSMAATQGFKISSMGTGWGGLGSKNIFSNATTRVDTGGGGNPNNIGVTSAGDVNGDGFEDFIMGENLARLTTSNPYFGRAFVLFGTSAGMSSFTLPSMSVSGTASVSPTVTNGFFIDGNANLGQETGTAVGGGGDVNGDGLDDLVVSTLRIGTTKTASVFVAYGKESGTSLNIASLSGASTLGFQITNAGQTSNSSGVALTAELEMMPQAQLVGDINGDGLADITIGQYDRAVVVFGKATAGAVDAAAIAAGTSTQGFVIQGDSAKTGTFGFLVNAGDMNGDGLADMVLNTSSNHAYVVFGQTAGGISINLTSPDLTKFVPIANEVNSLGQSVISAAGDVNGDGFDDIVIGVSLADPASGANRGKSYVVYGGFSDVTSAVFQVSNGDVIGTSGNDTISGSSGSNQLVGGAGDDLITGNGGADVMYGGAGNDTFVLNADNVAKLARNSGNTAQDVAHIDGGHGFDTIKLDGAGISLDLTAVRNDVVSQVENIDISGSGANTVKLSLTDVLDLGDNNSFDVNPSATDVRKQLMISGDADDKVVLSDLANWSQATGANSTFVDHGHTYQVYNHNTSSAQLLIDQLIQSNNITAS